MYMFTQSINGSRFHNKITSHYTLYFIFYTFNYIYLFVCLSE